MVLSLPRNAFNMARYIDDNQQSITQHQEMLATAIEFPREQWVFQFKLMKIKL